MILFRELRVWFSEWQGPKHGNNYKDETKETYFKETEELWKLNEIRIDKAYEYLTYSMHSVNIFYDLNSKKEWGGEEEKEEKRGLTEEEEKIFL